MSQKRKSTFKINGTRADLPRVNLIGSFDSTRRVGTADKAKDSVRGA